MVQYHHILCSWCSAIFTVRRYDSAVLAVIVCLSVRHKSELYKDG